MSKENQEKQYIAIDLKSFYASVECRERGLDPLRTNLVVADINRTEKTICLAVTPSLKSFGIPGRARLFEVVQKVKEANAERKAALPLKKFEGASYDASVIASNPAVAIDYVVAKPRMALYMDYSTKIYNIYLKYVAKEDMHVYSVDEVFIDVTSYLKTYGMTAKELAMRMIRDVLDSTGITATAGVGTNMYLCKVAMDIVAKHIPADENGVRIAELNEASYREKLWTHEPITDFWRIGRGYAKKLKEYGMYTMGDVALCSVGGKDDFYNEELLYKLFGVNAELLIDHAWGYEPCTIEEIKQYRPENNSTSLGQVLQCPYTYEKTKIIVREMTEHVVLDMVDKNLVTDQMVLTVGYDIENLTNPEIKKLYRGPVTTDHYGRKIPKHAHGTVNLGRYTSSTKLITDAVLKLYEEIVGKNLLIRRIYVVASHVVPEQEAPSGNEFEQLSLFTDYDALEKKREEEANELLRERKMQEAMLSIKKKYGKNAILKGTNLQEGATAKDRNRQIGGHRA